MTAHLSLTVSTIDASCTDNMLVGLSSTSSAWTA
jgi:hypothetical protein